MAVSLLAELLKLDWRKRINAIDALKHPYFFTPPLPAQPGELPRFEDSHELDRRKFRGQKAAMPPAPAGGSVGMGPNGGWATNSGPRPGLENRNSRIPGAARAGKPGDEPHSGRIGQGIHDSSRPRESGLPPKPPAPAYKARPGPPGRDGRYDQRRDRTNQGRFGGRMESSSYVPNYGARDDRLRSRDGYNPGSFPPQSNRRNQRDYDSRRSRSPNFRYDGYGVDRALYRR